MQHASIWAHIEEACDVVGVVVQMREGDLQQEVRRGSDLFHSPCHLGRLLVQKRMGWCATAGMGWEGMGWDGTE